MSEIYQSLKLDYIKIIGLISIMYLLYLKEERVAQHVHVVFSVVSKMQPED